MPELIALRVKIGLNEKGAHKYPDFNKLGVVKSSGMDWAHYLDSKGSGWQYDKVAGHKEVDAESPNYGEWIGQILVPVEFADEAKALFPLQVEELSPEEAKRFYEERCAVGIPEYLVDEGVLAAIKFRKEMGIVLSQRELDAIDPDKDEPGIVRPKDRSWDNVCSKRGWEVKARPGQKPKKV